MDSAILRELRELIKKMEITLSPNTLFIRDILQEQRNRTLQLQLPEAMQLIRELQDNLYKVEYAENWRLVRMLIAMCYFILDDIHTARLWAKDATRMVDATNKQLNSALAYWFLALVYAEDGYFKDSREQYTNAQNTFDKIRTNALNNTLGYQLKKECSKRISQIRYRMISISSQRTHLLDSVRRDQRVNTTASTDDTSTEQITECNTAGNVLIAPINVNVHVPIDNRFADHIDQRSIESPQLQKDQVANYEQKSMADTSIPIDFKNAAKQPGFSYETANVDEETRLPAKVFDFGYLITPSFPIYGEASAGPNGEVVLNEPNYNAAIDESSFVRLDGDEYEVYSLKSNSRRIKISHKDFLTSIIPRKMRKVGRKAYGWLKVTGNSMNKGKPIKQPDGQITIENDDYVLFIENSNMDANIGSIVIVSESLPDSGPVRLLVKRLVKENNLLLLRSYSRDKDPETGEEFEDLDFNECHQLIGEVIAVAKRRSPKAT